MGSLTWHTDRSDLPPGPTTMDKLFKSTREAVKKLLSSTFGPRKLALLRHNLVKVGGLLDSQYSGKGTAESALTSVIAELVLASVVSEGEARWRCRSAWDCKTSSQTVQFTLYASTSSVS